jgi:drug/metabolite transporter (DMT)-like permease
MSRRAMNVPADRPLRAVDIAALLAVYIIWGSTYYAIGVALHSFPPFLMAGARFLTAGILLYGFLRLRGAQAPTARGWGASAIVGTLLLVVGNGAVTFAQQWVSSSLAAIVVATMPLWAAVFARLAGQHFSRLEWAGLVVGFAGVATLNLGGELRAHGLGALVLAVAPLSWAFGTVWSRKLPLPAGPVATATEMICAGVIMIGIGGLRGEGLRAAPTPETVGAVAYLTVFGSIVAFSAYMHLVRNVRASITTSYAYVNPIIALFLGVALGGEHVRPLTWVSSAVIVGGVALISLGARPKVSGRTDKVQAAADA